MRNRLVALLFLLVFVGLSLWVALLVTLSPTPSKVSPTGGDLRGILQQAKEAATDQRYVDHASDVRGAQNADTPQALQQANPQNPKVKCPICEQEHCTQMHLAKWHKSKTGKEECNIFASIDYDLQWWKDGSLSFLSMRRSFGQVKGVAISWDGNRVRMVTERKTAQQCQIPSDRKKDLLKTISSQTNIPMDSNLTCSRKPQNRRGWLQAMLLVARLCKRVRLPPVEFVLTWSDNPLILPGKGDLAVFSLVKTARHRDILFPNHVRRADYRRDLNLTLNIFPQTVSWEKKIPKLFWRGSTMGVRKPSDVKIGRPRLACADRGPGPYFSQHSDVIDAGFVGSWKPSDPEYVIHLKKRCASNFVKPADNQKYKFLVVFDGTGFTNRFKDYLTISSVVLKSYKSYELYEFFEAGLQNSVHIFDVGNVGLSESKQVVRWCQANDEKCRQIARNANAYARWAFSDDTIDCYLYELLRKFSRKLGYDASTGGVVASHFEKRPMQGEYYDYIDVEPPPEGASRTFEHKCHELIGNRH